MNEVNIPNMKKSEIYNLVREKVKIEDVIASYGFTLKRSGSNYQTICPFHNDTKPSLSIQTKDQFFKCFTCGAKGTTIEFIMKMEQKTNPKFSFADAVIKLKNDFGLPIDIDNLEKQLEEEKYTINGVKYNNNKINAINMLEDITQKYQTYLMNTKQGQKHLEYLYSRGLTDETINKFQLGFAPREATQKYFDNIQNDAFKNALLDTGMINVYGNKKDNISEFFTDRITFPIKDAKGNTVGFTARTLDPRENSKYLNSRESDIFKKSELFFNWDNCINEAYKENSIVILEGNMDVIASDSLGLKNACGLNGVALSNDQIKTLKQANLPIILALDNDKAGHDATLKLSNILEKNELNVSIIDIGKFGKFKDNGDILMASMQNEELKNNFSEKYIALQQSVFSFRLQYDLFANKEITPAVIKNTYSKIEHELDSYKKVEFIDYCQKHSNYSKDDINNIINERNLNDNPYAKIGVSLIQPIINNININDEIKTKLVNDISNNPNKYIKINGLSFQLSKEEIISFIKKEQSLNKEPVSSKTTEAKEIKNYRQESNQNNQNYNSQVNNQTTKVESRNEKSQSTTPLNTTNVQRVSNYRNNQNNRNNVQSNSNGQHRKIDVFTIEGLKQIRRNEKLDDHIRQISEVGFVKPHKIEKNFNDMCKQYSSSDYTNMSFEDRKNELLKLYSNIISLKMFNGSNGRLELLFAIKAANKFGLKLNFDKVNTNTLTQMYQKASQNKDYKLAKKVFDVVTTDLSNEKKSQSIQNSQNNYQIKQTQAYYKQNINHQANNNDKEINEF